MNNYFENIFELENKNFNKNELFEYLNEKIGELEKS